MNTIVLMAYVSLYENVHYLDTEGVYCVASWSNRASWTERNITITMSYMYMYTCMIVYIGLQTLQRKWTDGHLNRI